MLTRAMDQGLCQPDSSSASSSVRSSTAMPFCRCLATSNSSLPLLAAPSCAPGPRAAGLKRLVSCCTDYHM